MTEFSLTMSDGTVIEFCQWDAEDALLGDSDTYEEFPIE